MSLNIFHIVSGKKWSGVEQYVYDLASELKKDGNYVEIVATKRESILNRFRPLEIPISILPLRRKADIESPIRFARLIKRGRNVVHVHNVKDARMALIARRISENRNTRVFLTCHKVEKAKKGFVHRMIYNDLDGIIFVSDLARKEFLLNMPSLDLSKTTVIYDSVKRDTECGAVPPFDIRSRYGISPSKKLMMFHGRVCPEKGISVLLRAVTQLDKDRFHLVVMGSGELKYMGEIKAFIVANQLLQNVTLIPYQDHVQPLVAQCDFGVLPSVVREAFGITNVEYMMLGKPHVSTNNGAQPEYIENYRTGLLVPPDDYKALAEAIETLLDDDGLCAEMGAAAKRVFDEKLDYSHFMERINAAYKK